MKTKLAEISLGFLSLLLLTQVLWFAYNVTVAETAPRFLWQQAGATLALVIGFTLLWRASAPQQPATPLQSFVLLLRSPRDLTVDQLRQKIALALGVICDTDNPQALNTITNTSPAFRIRVDGYSFCVNNSAGPYIEQTENTPANIPNVRLQQMVREHTAWLSVDLLEAPANATAEAIYRRLGRIIAALADDDCVGLCCPETSQLNVWHPTLIEYLQGVNPLRAVAELVDVPAVRVAANDTQMEEAAHKANSMWSVFVNAFDHRHPGQAFAIKAPFTDGQEIEYMWLLVSAINDEKVTGMLDNDPIYLRNIHAGDIVTVAIEQVNDWLYTDKGEIVGGFTTEALSKQMAA